MPTTAPIPLGSCPAAGLRREVRPLLDVLVAVRRGTNPSIAEAAQGCSGGVETGRLSSRDCCERTDRSVNLITIKTLEVCHVDEQ